MSEIYFENLIYQAHPTIELNIDFLLQVQKEGFHLQNSLIINFLRRLNEAEYHVIFCTMTLKHFPQFFLRQS